MCVTVTPCRDPADHAPAPPDRRSPSNCANLQAPGDTWVQLRTASLVEPVHHVSVGGDVTRVAPSTFTTGEITDWI